MSDTRPDPAALLSLANREAASARRGRLKIFFGMAPGVGKTYAMLAATQRLAAQGHDVVIGIVETHGRTETEQQILGLDMLPRKRVAYRGAMLDEFDLEAAIARHPELLIVDELAHTNAPGGGGRNEKRWQDVRDCLEAGINVYSTLNVQHVESLNDVVAQITGVRVRETVPDTVIEQADEIELVDLPPDALLDRLRAGKVYVPEQIAAATDSFFRKGNLTALRELALRRTAEWVDVQVQHERARAGDGGGGAPGSTGRVWAAADRILVCVGPSPTSRTLLRAAKRMAAGLRAELIAVFVDNAHRSLSAADRESIASTMKLAEELGASPVTISAGKRSKDAAGELLAFARDRNVSKVVVGKTARSRLAVLFRGSFMDEVIRRSGDINVYIIQGDDDEPATRTPPAPPTASVSTSAWVRSAMIATAGVLAATALGYPLSKSVAAANIAMLYLLVVAAVAYWADRRAATIAAVLGVATFDVLFVPPFGSFAVSDTQYLITFAAMLTVGLSIAGLTARLRNALETAREREQRAAALYALSRELAAARDVSTAAAVAARHLHDNLHADVALVGPGNGGDPSGIDVHASAGTPDWLNDRERPVARWTIDHAKPAGAGTATLPASIGHYMPVPAGVGDRATIALRTLAPLTGPQRMLIEATASLVAQAFDRLRLIDSREQARVEAESERLRNALLSSVSHDLRTPLAGIAGAASTIKDAAETLDPATRTALIDSIVTESARLNELIANLVFATRLDSGGIDLRREWTTLEEIVGAGLAPHRAELAGRPLRITGLSQLPMLRVDNAMMPQVIANLIANALRYTAPCTPISISAWLDDNRLVVKVADEGPGIPSVESGRVFDRFFRGRGARPIESGQAEPANSGGAGGLGLGLTICRGIVQAHGGRIWAEPNHPKGAAFLFSLPIEHPQPAMPAEEAVA